MNNKQFNIFKIAKRLLLGVLLFFCEQIPVMILEAMASNKKASQSWLSYAIFTLFCVLITMVMIWIIKKVQLFPTKRLDRQAILLVIASGAFLFLMNLALAPLFKIIGNTNVSTQLQVVKRVPVAFIIYALLIGPILEELLFRGYVQNMFNIDPRINILLSAVIFGLMHVSNDPIYFISKVVIGLILGFVYWKTRNIKASILVHLINNLTSLI